MKVIEAFDFKVQNKLMISIVGGGGKTSIMFRLAQELKSIGSRVLVTTTTHIYFPDKSLYDQFHWWDEVENAGINKSDLGQAGVTVIGGRMTDDLKLKGINKEYVDMLFEKKLFDVILVEADGAKGKPLKAPAEHEPVIPGNTTVLIGVIGIDCYKKKIDTLTVHRPEILSEITGSTIGDIIDDKVIEKLVLSEKGLFKNCPKEAEKVLFINKVREKETILTAQRIGSSVMNNSRDIEKVIIGSIIDKEPVQFILERKPE
jgi:probable selenium-dependent hydroxylase accessory protein YqeC